MKQRHSLVDPAFSAMMPEGQLAQFKDALRKLKLTINLPECSQEQLKSDWPRIEVRNHRLVAEIKCQGYDDGISYPDERDFHDEDFLLR